MTKLSILLALAFCLNANAQIITTVVGNGSGTGCYIGDGGPAISAGLNQPLGVFVDGAGNLFIADEINSAIRKVNSSTGIITTIAGNGTGGYSGDGGPATSAQLYDPWGVFVDGAGNLFIADEVNSVIRKVNGSTGIISTIAGNGTGGYSGDGGPATSAEISAPRGVFGDASGNLFITEQGNQCIRKINGSTGIITTFAGLGYGYNGYSGDGGPATNAEFHNPDGICVDNYGNVFIADSYNNVIRKVNGSTGIITTIAGNGSVGGGDGGPATNAGLNTPTGVFVDGSGNLFIAVAYNNVIRKVDGSTGIISTIAGNLTQGYAGDGGPATNAELWTPYGIFVDGSGNLFIADQINNRIRMVSPPLTTLIVTSDTICTGSTTTLTASGANTYTWSTGATTASIIVSPTVTTQYSVTGATTFTTLNVANESISIDTSTVTINAITVNSSSICMGTIDTLTAAGANTYTWNTGDTTFSIITSPSVTTTYTVSGTAGTCTPIATATITVNPIPGITTPTITPSNCGQCNGSIIGVNATGGSGTYYYLLNGAAYYSVPSYSWCAGTFYLAVVDSVTGCSSSTQTYTIQSIGSPTVSFNLVQDTMPHTWDAYPSYSSIVDSARWYWGDGTSTAGLYPSHTYSVAGTYSICVIVTDTAGCISNYCLTDSVYRLVNNSSYSSMVYVNVKSNATGIKQVGVVNNQISIYPNPNNGSFTIEPNNATKQTIEVYDVNGRLVLSQTVSSKTNVDANSLNEGVYNISINSGESVTNKRLVIVR